MMIVKTPHTAAAACPSAAPRPDCIVLNGRRLGDDADPHPFLARSPAQSLSTDDGGQGVI